jgi:opacity protein-like surface antigen
VNNILAAFLLLPAAALAQARPGATADSIKPRFLVAPKIGLFEPISRMSGALLLGAEVGYVTPALGDRLAVVLEVDWVRPRASGATADPRLVGQAGTYSLGNAEVGVLLSAVVRLEDLVPRLTPYGGMGPGLYFHRTSTSAFGSRYVETETRVGMQMMAGADYALGPGAGFAEIRYHFSRVNFLATGNANLGGFLALSAGYRFRF